LDFHFDGQRVKSGGAFSGPTDILPLVEPTEKLVKERREYLLRRQSIQCRVVHHNMFIKTSRKQL